MSRLKIERSPVPAGKGPFTHTTLLKYTETAISYARPGLLNLCQYHFALVFCEACWWDNGHHQLKKKTCPPSLTRWWSKSHLTFARRKKQWKHLTRQWISSFVVWDGRQVTCLDIFQLLDGQNKFPHMLLDGLFILIKNTFHYLLRVVHTDPILSNKKPDSIRLFFDFMLR